MTLSVLLIEASLVSAEPAAAYGISNAGTEKSVHDPTDAQLSLGAITIEQEMQNAVLPVSSESTSNTGEIAASSAVMDMDIETLLQRQHYAQVVSRLSRSKTNSWRDKFWLGTAYLMSGQLDDAADALDDALALNSNVAEIWVQRATVEQEQAKPTIALQLLQVASRLDPDCSEIYLNAAYAHESLGQWDAARSAYGHFLKLSTGKPGLGQLRRTVLSRLSALQPQGKADK